MASEITALVPWYGSNRQLAERVGAELRGCSWVGVPFAGSMTELRHIEARTLLVADLHRHLINLADVMADPDTGPQVYRRLRRAIVHPEELERAQVICASFNAGSDISLFPGLNPSECVDPIDWACAYFIVAWMGRSAVAGTPGEFRGGLATRWTATGGDSAVRFQSAVRSLPAWRRLFRRCTFAVLDCFEFMGRVKDTPRSGIYCDPPWPDAGDGYVHPFCTAQQRRLARRLARFEHARIVIRYGDHPLIRELYPADRWTWIEQTSRSQANGGVPEVLIINGESITGGGA